MTTLSDAGSARSGRAGRRAALIIAAIVSVIALVLAGGSFAYAKQFEGKALPGTTVLGQDVSGKSPEDIAKLVSDRAGAAQVTVTAGDQTRTVSLPDVGATVDAAATAKAATARDTGVVDVLRSTLDGTRHVEPVVSVDRAAAARFATSLLPADRTAAADAKVTYDEDAESWTVVPGHAGQSIDAEAFADAVAKNAPALQSFTIDQPITESEPALTDEKAQSTVDAISRQLEEPMVVKGPEDKTFEVSPKTRSTWMSVGPNPAGDDFAITVDEKAVSEWVAKKADAVGIEPVDGIEQVDASGAVTKVLSEKKDGIAVSNADAVTQQLTTALREGKGADVAFETAPVAAKATTAKAPGAASPEGKAAPTGEKWIDVDLSKKTLTAYVGDTPVWGPRKIVDGKEGYETITGTYRIYLRYEKQDMTNASRYPESDPRYYFTEDVPWVQYFKGGYAIHGAPWRSSFGYSGSHGCINMSESDAKWMYNWASEGTKIVVHH